MKDISPADSVKTCCDVTRMEILSLLSFLLTEDMDINIMPVHVLQIEHYKHVKHITVWIINPKLVKMDYCSCRLVMAMVKGGAAAAIPGGLGGAVDGNLTDRG